MKPHLLAFLIGLLAAASIALPLAMSRKQAPEPNHVVTPELSNSDELVRPSTDRELPEIQAMATAADSDPASAVELAAAIREIGSKQIENLCEDALGLAVDEREKLLVALLGRWAETDGEAAMIWGRDHLRGEKPWLRCHVSILDGWAATDAAGLTSWFLEHRDERDWGVDGDSFNSRVIARLAPHDVVRAAEASLVERGYSSDVIFNALRFYITTPQQARGIATLLEGKQWLHTLEKARYHTNGRVLYQTSGHPNHEIRQVAMALESRWPEIDPVGWERWREQHPQRADGRDHASEVALEKFTIEPSAQTANATLELTPAELRSDTRARIIDEWVRHDIDAAGIWLGNEGFGEGTAAAVAVFAAKASSIDPEAAFSWIEAVPDDARRERMFANQFLSWASTDPERAQRFLSEAQWPEDRRLRLELLFEGTR